MIGWVYETPHDKVKEAERDLEDFYNDDLAQDLQDTADKEKDILDQRIEQWELYLQALEWRFDEQERILRDQLLMELLNVESQEEIADRIFADWDEFNSYCEGSFKHYDGIFNNFMDSYRDNVLELDSLQKQMQEVLSSTMSGILGQNNQNIQMGINNTGNISEAMGMSAKDQAALTAAGKKYTIAQNAYLSSTDENLKAQLKQAMEQAHAEAEAIRAKYGYSGGADGSALIVTDKGLYSQYMGSGYKDQMQTEENFLNFYDNLFGDFGDLEDDRLSGISSFANGLANNYNQVNSQNNSYLNAEGIFLDEHNYNGQYQSSINDSIIQDWLMYVNDAGVSYDYVIMDFQSFLDKYRAQIEEYAQLQIMLAGSMNSGLGGGNYVISGSGGSTSSGMVGDASNWEQMSAADQAALNAAGEKYNQASALYQQTGDTYYKEIMEQAHKDAESIRNKYGYSGGEDGSDYIITTSNIYSAISDLESDRISDYEYYVGSVASIANDLNTVNTASNRDYSSYAKELANLYNLKYSQDVLSNQNEKNNVEYHGENAINQANINAGIISDWLALNEGTQVTYDLLNQNFGDFLDTYANQIQKFANLKSQLATIMGSNIDFAYDKNGNLTVSGGGISGTVDKWLGNASDSIGASGPSGDAWLGGQSFSEWLEDNDAPSSVVIGEIMKESGMDYDEAKDYYNDYVKNGSSSSSDSSGSSGSGGSNKGGSSSSSNKGSGSSSSNKGSSSSSSSSDDKPSWVGVSESMKDTGKGYEDTISKYAGGIEEGPVTYTGLAMLHGSTSKPEYVLNNDQAYNLLYNLSSSRLSDFETKDDNNGETYVYNIGEVNVDGTDDPADFWSTVMNAAGNRHNVTKNGTYKNR